MTDETKRLKEQEQAGWQLELADEDDVEAIKQEEHSRQSTKHDPEHDLLAGCLGDFLVYGGAEGCFGCLGEVIFGAFLATMFISSVWL